MRLQLRKYISSLSLVLFTLLLLPACPPGQQGLQPVAQQGPPAAQSSTHWLSAGDLIREGWTINTDQALGDVVPPQPQFIYKGQTVSVIGHGSDVRWTAFAIVLHLKDDGTLELLTQKRASRMANPLKIEGQGGHLHANQSWREGVAQEIREEAGITVPARNLIFQNDNAQGVNLYLSKKGNATGNAIFIAVFTGDRPSTKLSGESDPHYGHQWVPFNDILIHADKNNKTPMSAQYYGTLLDQVFSVANPKAKVHIPVVMGAQQQNAGQIHNIAFYLVPNKATRKQLEAISPGNSEFKKWGGPHVTVGGFANVTDAQVAVIARQLEALNNNWKLSHPADITMKNSGTLATAHFNSALLDQGKMILEHEHWPNIKSNWHLTLGSTNSLTPAQQQAMAAALLNKSWVWRVCVRAKDGSVVWKPLSSY